MPMPVAYPFHRATRLRNTNNSVRRRRDTHKPTKSTTTLTRGQSTGTAGYACTKTWRWTCWDNRRDDRMVGLTYTVDHGHEGARTEARSPRLQLAFRSKMDNGHEEWATNRSSAASISVASGLSLAIIQGWPQYQIRSCHRQRSKSAQLVEHITKLWSALISEGIPSSGSPTIGEGVSRTQLQQGSRHTGRGRALSSRQPEASWEVQS
jgi:hypothetical protein